MLSAFKLVSGKPEASRELALRPPRPENCTNHESRADLHENDRILSGSLIFTKLISEINE